MTKKVISAAAAVAALTLAAGSAGAHAASSPADASIAQSTIAFAGTGLNGTGVLPDTTSVAHDQGWIELENTDTSPASLLDHTVVGCVGADNDNPIVFAEGFAPNDEIAGGDLVRIAHPAFIGPANYTSEAVAELDSVDFDLRLVDNFGGFPEDVLDQATNGNPDPDCVASLPPITP